MHRTRQSMESDTAPPLESSMKQKDTKRIDKFNKVVFVTLGGIQCTCILFCCAFGVQLLLGPGLIADCMASFTRF